MIKLWKSMCVCLILASNKGSNAVIIVFLLIFIYKNKTRCANMSVNTLTSIVWVAKGCYHLSQLLPLTLFSSISSILYVYMLFLD